MQLDVFLGGLPVGVISLENVAAGVDQISFELLRSYLDSPSRPVLGQQFVDDPSRRTSHMRAPSWFSNLLPEGALRTLLADRFGVHFEREFFLLGQLGEDLPGAVRVRPRPNFSMPEREPTARASESGHRAEEDGLRFSLAGVQLKFSMVRDGKGLTIPARGVDGEWIVKLPGQQFASVVENEFSVMTWAREAGIDTPQFELVDLSAVKNLPREVGALAGKAYAIRRFDRVDGRRVHQEDLAQVEGVYAHQKYDGVNYETIAALFLKIAGREALDEFVRRLVFIIASGNEDAHLKNWSLVYPTEMGGRVAKIAPAYDFVSTLVYSGLKRGLGLNFGGSRDFSRMSTRRFERLGERLGVDVVPVASEARRRTLEAWTATRERMVWPAEFTKTIDEHLERIPFFRETP